MRAIALLLVLATIGVACSPAPADDDGPRPGASATSLAVMSPESSTCAPPRDALPTLSFAFCSATRGMKSARVLRIIDGDTLDVLLDGREERIRVFGIDTPERGDRCFGDATRRLEALAGTEVRLQSDVRERDRYGRLLRYLYTPGGRSIDATMIFEGLARAWTQDGALRDPLLALETDAARARRGCLW